MQVGELLRYVAAQTAGTPLPCVGGKEGDVLEVGAGMAFEEDAHATAGGRGRRGESELIALPCGGGDGKSVGSEHLRAGRGGGVDELDAQAGRRTRGEAAGPHGEAVGLATAHAHAEKAFVVEAGVLVAVAGGGETHIVGAAREGRAVGAQLHTAESAPCGEMLRELEGAVLDHLGV